MESVHKPVLLHEIVEHAPKAIHWYVDGTLGGAGHALAIAKAMKGKLSIIGFDKDPDAVSRAEKALAGKAEKVVIENADFRKLAEALDKHGIPAADFILLDLGISSDELDNSGRGFSFQKDEPIHMTMGDPEKAPFTAHTIVNSWKEEDIANVIFAYGEERYARRIAKAIVVYRTKKPIETTHELAEIVKMSVPFKRGFGGKPLKIHPATKTFQALRIAVNDELGALKEGLAAGFERLAPGGRIAVISFHSLEDRIVKQFFQNAAKREAGKLLTKKPIVAGAQEIAENPRSRSAKLRILEKI
jgi:16S rRNA (cytosine1402-N4)-methyltransferase